MTYATSISINAPRKYNTIKTNAPDYLLVILSRYSSKSDGPSSLDRPQRPPTPNAHIRLPQGTVRFLSGSACLFFCGKKKNNTASPPLSPEAAAGIGPSPSSPTVSRQAPLQGHVQTPSSPTGELRPHDGPGGRPSKDPHGLSATRYARPLVVPSSCAKPSTQTLTYYLCSDLI